jgi:hypothetical protein
VTTDGKNYTTVYSDTSGETINFCSLSAATELLAAVSVSAGSYTSARVTFGTTVTLVGQSGTSTTVTVDPSVGTQSNGQVAIVVATPTQVQSGQTSALVVDFNLAEFQLVGSVLRPALGPGGPNLPSTEPCLGHLVGTVQNLVAGTSFTLQSPGGGPAIAVDYSSSTAIADGQTGAAATLSNGLNVMVDGSFDPTTGIETATSITIADAPAAAAMSALGSVVSVDIPDGTFVLTVLNAQGFQPTTGTITVQTNSSTTFMMGNGQQGSLSSLSAGMTVNVNGTLTAQSTLTAQFVGVPPSVGPFAPGKPFGPPAQ